VFSTFLAELRLNDNALTGAIPDQIGRLGTLVMLTLENNDLSGDIPADVCRFDGLQTLTVDCDDVDCDCCSLCSEDDTTAPMAPSDSPSALASTPCEDAIRVFSPCFGPDDDVVTSLSNCLPEDDDWIGLYAASDDIDNLPNPSIWSWACGSRFCREAVTNNSIALNEEHSQNGDWPLDEGTYRVVLARNSPQPYTAYAVSTDFRISNTC
jgi:hypothetical protein